jgi:hypothetical protein
MRELTTRQPQDASRARKQQSQRPDPFGAFAASKIILELIVGATRLLHVKAMRTRRSCREGCVKVHVKTRIQLEAIFEHLDYVHVMVAFKVDFPEVILIKEVISNDQSFVVVGEHDVVRAGVHAQVDDSCLEGMLGVAYVKHADLPGLE